LRGSKDLEIPAPDLWNLSQLRNQKFAYVPARRTVTALCATTTIALALFCRSSAYAANSHAPPAAPEPVPVFTWAGAYLGVNFGGGFGLGSTVSGFGTDAALQPNELWSFSGPNPGGVLGGLQAGYNWQWGNIVAGVEADMEAAGLSGS
jgi:outer membrane immunogenic protein